MMGSSSGGTICVRGIPSACSGRSNPSMDAAAGFANSTRSSRVITMASGAESTSRRSRASL